MSQLSHDIHAQELLARSVVEELRGHAQTVRNLHATSWEATSAEAFRRSLDHLAREIDACRDEADRLVDALSAHARQVAANEASVSSFFHGIETGAEHLVHEVGDDMAALWHGLESGAETAWHGVETGAQEIGHELREGAEHTWRNARPAAEIGKALHAARSPW